MRATPGKVPAHGQGSSQSLKAPEASEARKQQKAVCLFRDNDAKQANVHVSVPMLEP